jgi:hypothetical protein
MATDAIPPAKYDYGCVPSGVGTNLEIRCITLDMSFVDKITHVMFMEGGGDSVQLMVDLLQVVLNDDYNAWTCSIFNCTNLTYRALNPNKIPWADITTDQFERLTLFVLSQPYHIVKIEYPVWNGWGLPLKWGSIQQYPGKVRNYDYTEQAVQLMLDNCVGFDLVSGYTCIILQTKSGGMYYSQHPVRVTSVTNVYSTTGYTLCPGAPVVAIDRVDAGGGKWEYVSFLTAAGMPYDRNPCPIK